MSYKMVSTPATIEDVEEMSHCIHEAYSIGVLLSVLSEEAIDSHALNSIGNNLVRLLGQPMEATGEILSEKREAAEADTGGAS